MQAPLFRDRDLERRLDEYVDALVAGLGHADRASPFTSYLWGLLSEGDRKSVEPMAMRSAPGRLSGQHQSMLHLVGQSPWSDEGLLRAIRAYALPAIEKSGEIDAWIVDDTGIVKKGTHSVGVARQYCGRLGKQENCQVAVTLSVANELASLPIGYRLYLPQSWVDDTVRREEAHVPKEIVFQTKPEIALDQIRRALADGVRPGVLVADAGYGDITEFRDQLTAAGLPYMVGIKPTTSVWPEGEEPLPPKRYSGRGARPRLLRRGRGHKPVLVRELAASLPRSRFRSIKWREGTAHTLCSRFAAVRVRPAHGDTARETPRNEEWLLIEWPSGESEPTKYSLSTLPPNTSLKELVRFNKCRWRIERDYEELKGELGLHHFEGRSWRGFHHHATLCIAAYAFLAAERGRFPPGGSLPDRLPPPPVPRGLRPRGSPGSPGTPQSRLDRHSQKTHRRSPRRSAAEMPNLPSKQSTRATRPKRRSRHVTQ